jgi:hypothetical protein
MTRLLSALLAIAAGCTTAEGPVLTGPYQTIEIALPSPVVEVSQGIMTGGPIALSVQATTAGGETVRLPARAWRVSDPAIARVDAGGFLVADGYRGGDATITATVEIRPGHPFDVSADIEVRVRWFYAEPPELFAEFPDGLATPDPIATPALVHPLAGALVPSDVAALSLRWQGGDPGDLELAFVWRGELGLVDSAASFVAARMSGAGGVDVDRVFLRAILETAPDSPITIVLGSVDGETGAFTTGPPTRIELVPSTFAGSIAYQETSGRLLDVGWSILRRTQLVPSVPPRGGDRCIGCHAFSSDRVFAASVYDTHEAALAHTYEDLARDPPPLRWPFPTRGFVFPALTSAGATRRMLGVLEGELALFDVDDLDDVRRIAAPALPALGTHPALMRDLAAWALRTGGDPIRFTASDLEVAALTGDAIAAPATIVRGADLAGQPEGGLAISHPTFSADGAWIAFAHGPSSTLGYAPEPEQRSAIYLVPRAGGAPVRLSRASLHSTPLGGPSAGWPVFLPWTSDDGAYLWLAYTSRMPLSALDVVHRRQIWITAIDVAAASRGEDPSRAPFLMPGQDPLTSNFAPQVHAQACLADGYPCTTDAQCCSASCTVRPEWGYYSGCAPE